MENIIIDKIETKAMEAALLQGQMPFALFKPAKGIPVLVKVTPSGELNHVILLSNRLCGEYFKTLRRIYCCRYSEI